VNATDDQTTAPFGRLTRRGFVGAGLGAVAFGRSAAARAQDPILGPELQYEAFVPSAVKLGQYYWYTCEFDAAWIVLKTFGIDPTFEEQLAIVGWNQDPEPWHEDTAEGVLIHGGDPTQAFCGDYQHSFLARLRSQAMRKLFDHYGLDSRPIRGKAGIRSVLRRGGLAWMKVTVDFLPYIPATWVTPDGRRFPTAFTNDHAVVVSAYNNDVVLIQDPLGPTDTNWDRQFQYEVPWDRFVASAEAHGWDGLAVRVVNT